MPRPEASPARAKLPGASSSTATPSVCAASAAQRHARTLRPLSLSHRVSRSTAASTPQAVFSFVHPARKHTGTAIQLWEKPASKKPPSRSLFAMTSGVSASAVPHR